MSYNAKTNRGAGYGVKGGDPRVHALQRALNRLGLTDGHGHPLAVDGRLGPLTTQAIKAAQTKLGLKADGVVSASVMVAILGMKRPPAESRAKKPRRTARQMMSGR